MGEAEFCRVCADFSDHTNPLFEGNLRKLLSKIKDITGLQLKNLKDLPENICKTCEKQILQAHKFRSQCIRAQKLLGALCDPNAKETSKSKKIRKPENDEAPAIEEVNVNEIHTFKVEVVEEDDEKLLLKHEPIHTDDNSNDGLNFSRDATKDEQGLHIESGLNLVTSLSNKIDLKPQKSKSSEKRTENNYVCDQCGKYYTVKNLFQMHMMRHTGIRPYPCKLCPKGYYATNDLRRHMYTHTGERPYHCKYCELRFNDKSHRLIHTRREHTHERPFACDQCPKTFFSSCTFRTHITTHSGVRAFACKLCNVSYKRQSHLGRHNHSVTHKQNLEKQTTLENPTTVVS